MKQQTEHNIMVAIVMISLVVAVACFFGYMYLTIKYPV